MLNMLEKCKKCFMQVIAAVGKMLKKCNKRLVQAMTPVGNMLKKCKKRLLETKTVLRFRTDIHFRVRVTLALSLLLNIAYAIFNLSLALYHKTVWYGSFAVYYMTMSAMRLVLFRYTGAHAARENLLGEIRRYRFCGYLLAFMHSALLAVVFSIAVKGMEIYHHEITTITMATYTFLSLTLSIIGFVRYKRYDSPVYSAVKAVGLASSLVSLLILETAMLTVFGGDGDMLFKKIMTAATGGAIVLFILVTAVYMIINSYSKKYKNEVSDGKQK